jgi:hypothetical protein
MSRVFLLVIVIVATAGAALAYGDPKQISKAGNLVTEILRKLGALRHCGWSTSRAAIPANSDFRPRSTASRRPW